MIEGKINEDALGPMFLYNRLKEAYLEHDRLIIAYDIDDTVRPYKSKSCEETKKLIRRAKEVLNPYFIIYTANPHNEKIFSFFMMRIFHSILLTRISRQSADMETA